MENFAMDSTPGQVKFSMKGVNKGQFENPMSHQSIATYKQYKNTLTYFYPKHKVLEDGRSTVPLDI